MFFPSVGRKISRRGSRKNSKPGNRKNGSNVRACVTQLKRLKRRKLRPKSQLKTRNQEAANQLVHKKKIMTIKYELDAKMVTEV